MKELTELLFLICRALSTYKLLTNAQLQSLGISHSRRYLQAQTKALSEFPSRKKPLIGAVKYPPVGRLGRLHHVYYLTEGGAKYLNLLYPEYGPFVGSKPPTRFIRDHFHRTRTVNVHIRLKQMLEQKFPKLQLETFESYFEKTGDNRRSHTAPLHARTRVELAPEGFLIPDAVAVISQQSQLHKKLALCFEVSNGRDCKRILRQMGKHAVALKQQAISQKYEIKSSPQICFVISELGLLQAVLNRVGEVPQIRPLAANFLLATYQDFVADPECCWQKPFHGAKRYSFLTGKTVDERNPI
jgi:hypothetical protein